MKLELRSVKKDFISKSGKQHTCKEKMNLIVNSGEFHLLYGSSGSGKTTLLNIMTGMLRPSEGQVLLDGNEIHNRKEEELARLRRDVFGYAMQSGSLLSSLTVYENIVLPLSFFGGRKEEEARKRLQETGLWKVRDSYPLELSGGEYRRCTIVRALMRNPKFLFADEPTSNLDDENADVIIEMLKNLQKEGTAVVVATHDKRFMEISDAIVHTMPRSYIE